MDQLFSPPGSIPVFREEIPITDTDVDDNHHVNNTRYVHWMQLLATDHSDQFGWTWQRYLENHYAWVARRHTIDYIRPAFRGDVLLAETWVAEMKNVSSIRRYRFTRKSDGQTIVEAETRWAFVNVESGRVIRVPDEIKSLFNILSDRK